MAALAISEAASGEIRRQFQCSTLERPIASLLDSSQSFPTSAEMVNAISRNAGNEEMLALAMKEHRERGPTLKMHLDVGVYDIEQVPAEYRVEVAGFPFAMSPVMFELLNNHVLDYDGEAFVLRHGGRVFRSLSEWSKGLGSAV